MEHAKQVSSGHYNFETYMTKKRWASVWHQVDELLRLKPASVLEIGPGAGLLKAVLGLFEVNLETLDIDPELNPDHVASATALPFQDAEYDVVCAFQMLEHLPYETSLAAFAEMVRVSKRNVVISLPDARRVWRYHLHVPTRGPLEVHLPRPQLKAEHHVFDGEHHWEINKRGFLLDQIIEDFSAYASLTKTYRVPENAYHRFFVFECG